MGVRTPLAADPPKSQVTIVMEPRAGSLDLNSVAVETGKDDDERTEREGGSQGWGVFVSVILKNDTQGRKKGTCLDSNWLQARDK